MTAYKWDFETLEVSIYQIPDAWHCTAIIGRKDEMINCAMCGREVAAGECRSSKTIHSKIGAGYLICKECKEGEDN